LARRRLLDKRCRGYIKEYFSLFSIVYFIRPGESPGGGGTPIMAHTERPRRKGAGTFFRLQVYKRIGILQVKMYERVGQSVISVFERKFNSDISNRHALRLYHLIY